MDKAVQPALAGARDPYKRRRPEETALYQLVKEHLETFLAQVELETGAGALAQKLDVDLQPDEDPGPVAVDNAETQRALEALSDERDGEDAIEEFETSYEKSEGRKPKRVSTVLSLMGQASEDVDFYERLFQHLVEKGSVGKGRS